MPARRPPIIANAIETSVIEPPRAACSIARARRRRLIDGGASWVHQWCMKRTNVVVDDKLLGRAKRLTGLRTTRDLLDRALRELVAREEQRRFVEQLRSSGWIGDLDAMRRRRCRRQPISG